MDLITNSIQRAFTDKCVAEVREETDKKQVSNLVAVDTSVWNSGDPPLFTWNFDCHAIT